MSEMISKVARALFLSQHPNAEWSAGRARIKWFHMAEAAIDAMQFPTDKVSTAVMIAAGKSAEIFDGEIYIRADAGERIIEAMVDAALSNAPAQPPGAET